MKERLYEERNHSKKVRITEEDTGCQDRRGKSQALRKTTCPSHGCVRKQIPSHPESTTSTFQKRLRCQVTSKRMTEVTIQKVERWEMPTWCHMFNSTLTGSARVWFDDLHPESVDIYDDLKKAFLANFLQQKKCIKDLVEIHHIKKREGESTEDFVQRFKTECRHVKGAPECMRIYRFMHEITNPRNGKAVKDKAKSKPKTRKVKVKVNSTN
ncbi:reverse transcriptase domain-containing protein [Tanacetum coccineum]